MRTWLEIQNEKIHEAERQREAAAKAKLDKAQVRAVPMRERVKRLIRDIPDHERHWPWPIDYFVSQLEPRWNGGRASPRDVARGLRENGWVRHRNWKGEQDGYRTFWVPPVTDQ